MMTLDDLEKIEKEYLIPTQIAPILGCAAYNINVQVKEDKKNGTNSFPFPTILIGTRIRIPKRAFIEVMRHGTAN
ncbi:MAG: hypothetical protein J6S92_03725 [Oscillospiraceae bacterium]|nr:hypothetical protein [Bacteroidaceae bacterium]MBP0974624.1 hypothetical protein [Oscillospiraceae bacterium]MBP0987369.1 hypothetical protein [Oscillospiraceae bacterium]